MKITQEEVNEKLMFVNMGLEKRHLPQYWIEYNTKGRGQYRLKSLPSLFKFEETDWMALTNLWYFLDGMLTLMIEQGD